MNIIQQPLLHAVAVDSGHPIAMGILFVLIGLCLTSLLLHTIIHCPLRRWLFQITYGDYWLRRARHKSAMTRTLARAGTA